MYNDAPHETLKKKKKKNIKKSPICTVYSLYIAHSTDSPSLP